MEELLVDEASSLSTHIPHGASHRIEAVPRKTRVVHSRSTKQESRTCSNQCSAHKRDGLAGPEKPFRIDLHSPEKYSVEHVAACRKRMSYVQLF